MKTNIVFSPTLSLLLVPWHQVFLLFGNRLPPIKFHPCSPERVFQIGYRHVKTSKRMNYQVNKQRTISSIYLYMNHLSMISVRIYNLYESVQTCFEKIIFSLCEAFVRLLSDTSCRGLHILTKCYNEAEHSSSQYTWCYCCF